MKNGFTLIELIAVISLLSIITIISFASFDFITILNFDNTSNMNYTTKVLKGYYQDKLKKNELIFVTEKINNNEKNIFCISYQNVLDNGYIENNKWPKDTSNNKYKYAYTEDYGKTFVNTNDKNKCMKIKNTINTHKSTSVNNISITSTLSQLDNEYFNLNFSYKVGIPELSNINYDDLRIVIDLNKDYFKLEKNNDFNKVLTISIRDSINNNIISGSSNIKIYINKVLNNNDIIKDINLYQGISIELVDKDNQNNRYVYNIDSEYLEMVDIFSKTEYFIN